VPRESSATTLGWLRFYLFSPWERSWRTGKANRKVEELQSEPAEEFEKQTQNPVANLIGVPFQNNTDLNIGPFCARSKHPEQERASGASSGRFRREDLPV